MDVGEGEVSGWAEEWVSECNCKNLGQNNAVVTRNMSHGCHMTTCGT